MIQKKTRQTLTPYLIADIKALREKGHSMPQIAEQLDFHKDSLNRWLVEARRLERQVKNNQDIFNTPKDPRQRKARVNLLNLLSAWYEAEATYRQANVEQFLKEVKHNESDGES